MANVAAKHASSRFSVEIFFDWHCNSPWDVYRCIGRNSNTRTLERTWRDDGPDEIEGFLCRRNFIRAPFRLTSISCWISVRKNFPLLHYPPIYIYIYKDIYIYIYIFINNVIKVSRQVLDEYTDVYSIDRNKVCTRISRASRSICVFIFDEKKNLLNFRSSEKIG